MERVAEILRALLERALSEHGPQAPALADVLIERAQSHLPPQLGVQLSNGYRAWAPLSPADCYAFCESHSTWDLASLRAALLCEGQHMYLEMREDHAVFRRSQRQLREDSIAPGGVDTSLLERLRRQTDGFDEDLIWQRAPGEFPFGAARAVEPRAEGGSETRSETGRRLLQWWAQREGAALAVLREAAAEEAQPEIGDPSASMDLKEIFEGQGTTAELEALSIEAVLKANGIPCVLQGASEIPTLPFVVLVPQREVERAMAILEEAKASGPAAADAAQGD
jgi:hypothetical protein